MTEDAHIGRTLEGKYKLIRVLGTGGMGTVYEATHLLIKRRLAVKLLHAEYAGEEPFATRFKREAQTASAIGHDHIVDITDMGITDDEELFIVMEYLEGEDLATVLKRQPNLSPRRACHIMIQVLSALETAHAKGIIHRDLKPANIFLIRHQETDDYVKLVDFGISKQHQDDIDMTRGLTKTGELLGTPSFMSPEQARGELDIDGRSDVFSAGMLLYKLLTGKLPFEDKALTMLLLKILNDDPPNPCELNPRIPKRLGDLVMKAMAKDPEDRYADAASFRRVLQRYSPDTPTRTGLKVTQYTTGNMPFTHAGHDRRSTATPLQMVWSDTNSHGRRKRIIGIAAVFILIAVAAVAGVFYLSQYRNKATRHAIVPVVLDLKKTSEPVEMQPKEEIAAPRKPKAISINVKVTPTDAEVAIDGQKVGQGATAHEAAADNKPHDIVVSRAGYEPYRNTVVFDDDIDVEINLARALSKESLTETSTRSRRRDRAREAHSRRDEAADTPSKNTGRKEATRNPEASGAEEVTQPASKPSSEPAAAESAADPASPKKRPLRILDEVNPW